MKLTKKTESEVLQAYNTWLHSYLNGDVKTYDLYLDDDYHFIGSTNNEEFLNRKDTTQFFQDTAEQFSGKTELRNESQILEQFKELIFITHFFDAWFLSEAEWVYYGRFRFSSVLRNNGQGWRFIYQHFSMPDSKAQEGETIGYDQISAENLQLREAIKRRTVELENKNRELEIEASLERIRAQAMAMRESSDLLDIVVTMRAEFVNLGHEAHYFWHMRWLPEVYEKAMTSGDGTRIGMVMNLPRHIHGAIPLLAKWEKGKEPTVIYPMDVDAATDYVHKMVTLGDFQQVDPNAPSEDDIRHIGGLTFIMARTTHGEIGYSLPGLVEEVPKEDLEILVRFAGAFDLAHKRFEDLKKSEQQAREVQIELALERVRSRTMGMQKSEELKDVVKVIFDQLAHLSINAEHAGIVVDYEPKKDWHFWIAETQDIPAKVTVPYLDLVWDRQFTEAKKKGQDFFTTLMDFEEKNSFYKVLLPHIEGLTNKARDFYFSCPGLAASTVLEKDIGLYIENFSGTPYSTEENDVLKRFAKVFQQTYTRFLDLQKAEAQAREAQIELGLERVRARAMAMQHSRELSELVSTIFQELTKLDFALTFCIINVINEADRSNTVWAADPITGKDPESYYMKFEDYAFHHGMWDAWKARKNKWVYTIEGSDKKIYDEYLYRDTEFRRFPMEVQEANRALDRYVCGFTFSNFGGLQTVSEERISEANLDILARFGKVFDLTYTRFSDLKQAEAQAREAQIETALERVRSRTMAMQSSEELADAAFVLFEQLRSLGGNLWGTGFGLCEKNSESDTFWFAYEKGVLPPGSIPNTTDPAHKSMYEGWKRGADYVAVEASGEDLKNHYKYMMSVEVVRPFFQEILDKGLTFPEWQQWNAAYFSKGYLLIISLEPYPEPEILKRFAKSFDQTYTRFLDLKKAEAQARESEIQLALERVRASTMAMHRSEELSDVLATLFEQFDLLGINPSHAVLTLINRKKNILNFRMTGRHGYRILAEQEVDLKVVDAWVDTTEKWKKSEPNSVNVNEYPPEILPEVWEVYKEILVATPVEARPKIEHFPNGLFITEGYCRFGYIGFAHDRKPTEEEKDIVRRLAAEFGTLYQRFLDLQKAEAQAREAQIETALEKVRTRTMAMQKGEELKEVAVLLYKELIALGVANFVTCGYVEINEEMERQFTWVTSPGGDTLGLFYLPLSGDATFDERYAAWKRQQTIFHQTVAGETRTSHIEYAITTFNSKEAEEMVRSQFPDPTIFYCFNFSHGYLHLVTGSKLKEEEEQLLARFTRVFEQTYARFLDLKKAEAQAREAQIENALEKVRSRTMAMQKSHELPEAANNLFLQVQELGIPAWSAGYCIWETEDKKAASCNMSSEGEIQKSFILPTIGEGYNFYDPQKKGETFYIEELGGDALVKHYEFMRTLPKVGAILEELINAGLSLPTFQIFHILYFPHGYLMFITYEQVPEAHDIFKRFAKVFEQTYTRFLDLQKAEAQARESQIEAALEKIRSRSLAMHKSDELKEVVAVVLEKLQELNIAMESRVAVIVVFKEGSTDFNQWVASPTDIANTYISTPYIEHIILSDFWKAKKSGLDFYSKSYSKDEKNTYFKYFFENSFFENFEGIEDQKKWALEKDFYTYSPAFEKNSSLGIADFSGEPLSENEIAIIKRFAKVFEQAYIRFLDLQKAEAQAREAHIESALERVRARSMAMHKSEELAELSLELVKQVQALGVQTWFCAFNIYDDDPKGSLEWGSNGQGTFPKYRTPREGVFLRYFEAGQKGETLLVNEIGENECAVHYEYLCSLPGVGDQLLKMKEAGIPFPVSQIDHVAYFKYGYILFITYEPTPESHDIFKRFARVFEQTYTRFLDLKNVEAQTRSAQIETALERVRARALAMQDPEELTEVAEVLRYEMGLLGVEELETSSIYINDEENEKTECWYALKDIRSDGKKLVSDHFPLDLKDTWVGREMQKFYASDKKQVSIVMKGEERKEWIDYCARHSGSLKGYYGEEIPDRTYHLFKFSHGAIGAASAGEISGESWDLLKRAASVFSLAYSRFKDLTQARIDLERLKEEKKRAEEALRELQITQAQLIQSEKMASLGELTAGIAHEIQNPLNFVNNFSEVSVELIEEMNEELEKGDLEEAMAIIQDVRQNLAKINHHGKRADGIVKGMLQHSRSSGGEKEPTDLNMLADEYLRLAYHGLRAKDKSFNAKLETDYAENLGVVKVIPQDLGRVILNLITNAFYVVKEKMEQHPEGYVPTITVRTRKEGNKVLVAVKDNGNGIPDKIKEKIFQPFFTTKPTGQGTGLGLSLSYDIVKAHGGTLQCNSTVNRGTEFIIELPLK